MRSRISLLHNSSESSKGRSVRAGRRCVNGKGSLRCALVDSDAYPLRVHPPARPAAPRQHSIHKHLGKVRVSWVVKRS